MSGVMGESSSTLGTVFQTIGNVAGWAYKIFEALSVAVWKCIEAVTSLFDYLAKQTGIGEAAAKAMHDSAKATADQAVANLSNSPNWGDAWEEQAAKNRKAAAEALANQIKPTTPIMPIPAAASITAGAGLSRFQGSLFRHPQDPARRTRQSNLR